MLHLLSIIWTQGMQWCQWWYCWHHVMWIPAPMVSHNQKYYVAPDFSCLDLRNAMVPLTTLLASHDTNTNTSGSNGQKVMLHLVLIILTQGIQCCHWWHHQHHMTLMPTLMTSHNKKVLLHLISVVFTYQMLWCNWWYCWHHVMQMPVPLASHNQKVMLHLISIVLT